MRTKQTHADLKALMIEKSFTGFHPPTSNTTYTPNQFFDVCLPHCSRGTLRLIGFMLRKTLGWCDANGNPQHEQVLISYNELIKNSRIGRTMIRQSIDEAEGGNFIKCLRKGQIATAGNAGVSALYELKWDDGGEYTADPKKFKGFFSGQGNRTYIPNEFFDITLKTEPLRIIKVVGAILRHTIGFQNRFGHRRQNIQVSISTLKKQTLLTVKHLHTGLKEAIQKNYIKCLEEGIFDKNAGVNSQAATYTIRWLDSGTFEASSPKRITEQFEKDNGSSSLKKITAEAIKQSEKDNGTSSKRNTDQQFEKDNGTIREIKHKNKTLKQQLKSAVVVNIFERLKTVGFNDTSALEIIGYHPENQIFNIVNAQIEWLPQRNVKQNKLGLLKKAIKENWSQPQTNPVDFKTGHRGAYFARHFYAGCAGNKEEPTAEPTSAEIEICERYVDKLLKISPDESQIENWGRTFGEMFKSKLSNINAQVYISLLPALRSFGDEFYIREKDKIQKEIKKNEEAAREKHQKRYVREYMKFLRLTEGTFRENRREDYQKFLDSRESQCQAMINGPFPFKEWLKDFNTEESRLAAFQASFPEEILNFWGWDRAFNIKNNFV